MASTKTLTISGLSFLSARSYAVMLPDGATLNITGSNTITATDSASGDSHGVFCYGKLTVTGSGSLVATGGDSSCETSPANGVTALGDLTVNSGTLKGVGGSTYDGSSSGIKAYGRLTVNGGTVEGVGSVSGNVSQRPDHLSCGIRADRALVINGGNIKASGLTSALNIAPTLRPATSYKYRTAADGSWTNDSTAAYVYSAAHTYLEIVRDLPASYMMDFSDAAATWGGLAGVNLATTDARGTGWNWDASETTLTLSGINFVTTAAIAMTLPDGATVVTAKNTVNNIISVCDSSDDLVCGINACGSVSFKGAGTLNVASGDTSGDISLAIYAADGAVNISDGTLNATGGRARLFSVGIGTAGSPLNITGGTVNAYGGDAGTGTSAGLHSETTFTGTGSVNISGGTVKAVGSPAGRSFGVHNNMADLNVSGGTLTAAASTIIVMSPEGSLSNSLTSDDGYEPAASTTNCGAAVFGGGNITITGGTVKFSGVQAAHIANGNLSLGSNAWYKWRTSDSGRYTYSDKTAYTLNSGNAYIEITSSIPPTGDDSTPALWAALAVFSAAGLMLVFIGRRRYVSR